MEGDGVAGSVPVAVCEAGAERETLTDPKRDGLTDRDGTTPLRERDALTDRDAAPLPLRERDALADSDGDATTLPLHERVALCERDGMKPFETLKVRDGDTDIVTSVHCT